MDNLYDKNVNINGDMLSVKIPYGIKDEFKKCFRTAKFNGETKTWMLKNNTINKNKLQKFFSDGDVQNVFAVIEGREVAEENEKEISKKLSEVKEEFYYIIQECERDTRIAIKDAEKKIKELNEVNALLSDKRDELAKLKKELNEKKEEENKEKEKVINTLEGVIDFAEIRNCQDIMCKNYNKIYKENKYEFHAAQKRLQEIRQTYESALRLKNPTIDRLIELNWNRPDRDKPHNVFEDDNWVKKIHDE